jgi:hypothetical protein
MKTNSSCYRGHIVMRCLHIGTSNVLGVLEQSVLYTSAEKDTVHSLQRKDEVYQEYTSIL